MTQVQLWQKSRKSERESMNEDQDLHGRPLNVIVECL